MTRGAAWPKLVDGLPLDDTAWMKSGSCVDDPRFTEQEVKDQRDTCHTCPVAVDCLTWAIETEPLRVLAAAQTGHVYGGLTPKQIVKRGLAKPPMDPARGWREAS